MKIIVYQNPQDYTCVTHEMELQVENSLYANEIWLWESKNVCTIGRGKNHNKCISTNRGGGITYHRPGQRIIYFLMRIEEISVREFIYLSNVACCKALNNLNIDCHFKWNPVGIWHDNKTKIGSCGFRIKNKIIYHGIAINITNKTNDFHNACELDTNHIKIASCIEFNSNITMNNFDNLFIFHISKILDRALNGIRIVQSL